MTDFNKIFKDAVNGYEAPFDASAWDKLSNQLNNPMEDAFRNSLEGHEAPYNPNAWSAIKGKIGSTPSIFQWIAGSTAAAVLVATAIMLFPSDEEETTSNPIITTTDTSTPKNGAEVLISPDNNTENNNDLIADNSNENSDNTDNDINNDNSNQTSLDLNNSVENDGYNPIKNGSGQIPPTTDGTDLNKISTATPFPIIAPDSRLSENSTTQSDITPIVYSAEFSSSDIEICQGETILFNPRTIISGTVCEWNFGDGKINTVSNTNHKFESSGIFDVRLTVRDINSDKVLASELKTITVHDLPQVSFNFVQIHDYVPTYTFTKQMEQMDNIMWKVNDRMISDDAEFEYTFRSEGEHTVELSTVNEFGCSNVDSKKISVKEDFNLGAPKYITPEATTNNVFMPSALKIMDKNFTMIIYNQAGTQIYQTNNIGEPWNGRDINTNAMATSGMYVWIVIVQNENGNNEEYKGQVMKL